MGRRVWRLDPCGQRGSVQVCHSSHLPPPSPLCDALLRISYLLCILMLFCIPFPCGRSGSSCVPPFAGSLASPTATRFLLGHFLTLITQCLCWKMWTAKDTVRHTGTPCWSTRSFTPLSRLLCFGGSALYVICIICMFSRGASPGNPR